MQVRILKNDFCPFIEEMNALIGQTLNVVGVDDDLFQVEVGYWFDKGDVVVIAAPEKSFNCLENNTWKDKPLDTVTISRSDLQALQSLLKQEIKDISNMTRMMKKDAKYLASIGDKTRAGYYYKDHDKFRERTRSLEKRMKAVKKALT